MHKSIIVACFLLAFNLPCMAESCPSINNKSHSIPFGWSAHDSDNDVPLSAEQLSTFLQTARTLTLTQWSYHTQHSGTIHCFYRDKYGSNLNSYLSKDHYAPINKNNLWYQVTGSMDCAAGNNKCQFYSTKTQQQFAKN